MDDVICEEFKGTAGLEFSQIFLGRPVRDLLNVRACTGLVSMVSIDSIPDSG